MKVYVTYGYGTDKRNGYSVVEAEDYGKAREIIDVATNNRFAFAYTEEEFAGQVERYGLREVPLGPQEYLS